MLYLLLKYTFTMQFTNETIRREDRLLSETESLALLRKGEYGVLSMVSTEGEGYGIPLSYAWDGRHTLYAHCAPVGKKMDCLAANAQVSFCVVGHTEVIPGKFTTAYESVIVKGTAHTTLSLEEKLKALELILDKYSPQFKEMGMKYAEKSFSRTAFIKVEAETLSGKCKRI